MQLSPTPDLSGRSRLLLTALCVTLIVGTILLFGWGQIDRTLGDTDDALRIALVRDLLAGRGWFDQNITRLWPPEGVYLHWSRLLDGALAGAIWLLSQMMSPGAAEWAVRCFWPLLWIGPAVTSAMLIARSLGSRSAVFVTAVLLIFDLQPYIQFLPGRVDHHNVQISLCLVACAAAMVDGKTRLGGGVSGLATGLGLAIGLETLPFHALIGASFALRLAFDRNQAKRVLVYGLCLATASLMAFMVQTPPWRWQMSFCDAMGLNLVAALTMAGFGLAAVAALTPRASTIARVALTGCVGVCAGLIYLAAEPSCLHGPFAAMDPRVRSFWFDRIQEVQPWSLMLRVEPSAALHALAAAVLAVASLVLILRRRLSTATLLGAVLVLAAISVGFQARRMLDYLFWFSLPVIGAALGMLSDKVLAGRLAPTLAAALLFSPALAGAAGGKAWNRLAVHSGAHAPLGGQDRCYDTAAYGPLAALPKGVVMADIDFGSYILANTPHAALSAPYHRMSRAILLTHQALSAPPQSARVLIQTLHPTYLVDCRSHGSDEAPGSFAVFLRNHPAPQWLRLESSPGAALQIYRVSP